MRETLNIKEHMPVVAMDGTTLGTVDHLEGGNLIKLTKSGSLDGMHHFIPTDWVDHVDEHVHLNIGAEEARKLWQ